MYLVEFNSNENSIFTIDNNNDFINGIIAYNLFIVLMLMVQPSGQKLQIWLMRLLKSRLNILSKESLIFHSNIQC